MAADALAQLKASSYDIECLKKPQMEALVRALKVGKTGGNRPELKEMLVKRFGGISGQQFAEIETTVSRGLAVAALPPPAPEALQLLAPQDQPTEPPALGVQEPQQLATRKRRRDAAA